MFSLYRCFCIIRSPASLQDNYYFRVIFRISQLWDYHFSEPRLSRHRHPRQPNWLSRTPIAEIHQEEVHLLTDDEMPDLVSDIDSEHEMPPLIHLSGLAQTIPQA